MNEATYAPLALDDAARSRAGPAASWGAILAGAIVAVSVSLLLLTLGTGLGFAFMSPWPDRGISAGGFTVAGVIWLIVTQWLSAAIGGYIAGRLRQRWLVTHTHEVFFRDTAHGLVTWAVATLIIAVVLASSVTSFIGGGARALRGATAAAGQTIASTVLPGAPFRGPIMDSDASGGPEGSYDLDKLFRNSSAGSRGAGGPQSRETDPRMEALHIGATAATNGNLSDEDRTYLANLVASRTGIAPDEAQNRVDAFAQSVKNAALKAKAAADTARKQAATAALYAALSLLIGAFIASVAAAIGGRLRDEHL